jgi:hypothetical protein
MAGPPPLERRIAVRIRGRLPCFVVKLFMTDEQFTIWCAGFFDGEGSISIIRVGQRYHKLFAKVTQNDRGPLDRMRSRWADTFLQKNDGRITPTFDWVASNRIGQRFLREIEPFAIVKSDQIRIALEYLDRRTGRRGTQLGIEEIAEREASRLALLALKGFAARSITS